MYTHSSFPAALSLNAIVFFLGIWGTYLVFELSYSTKSDGKLTSLDQYISRMKSGQKDIFYITGSSKEQLEKSPFLERLKKKNYEVQLIVKRFGL
jgi:HSP90 family molecular chaperone